MRTPMPGFVPHRPLLVTAEPRRPRPAIRRSSRRCRTHPTRHSWRSYGSQPDRGRDLFWGVGGEAPRAGSVGRPTPSSRSSAPASAGATRSNGSRRARVERQVSARSLHRSGRVADSSGASATTSRRSTTSPNGRPTKARLAQSAAAGAVPREEPGLPRPRGERPLVVLPEPVRRHAAARTGCSSCRRCSATPISRTSRTPSTAVRSRSKARRRWYVARDLGQTFGRTGVLDAPRGDIEVFEETPFITGVVNGRVTLRLARPARRALRQHHAGRRPLDLRAAAGADRRAVARRVPRRRLSAGRSPTVSSAA